MALIILLTVLLFILNTYSFRVCDLTSLSMLYLTFIIIASIVINIITIPIIIPVPIFRLIKITVILTSHALAPAHTTLPQTHDNHQPRPRPRPRPRHRPYNPSPNAQQPPATPTPSPPPILPAKRLPAQGRITEGAKWASSRGRRPQRGNRAASRDGAGGGSGRGRGKRARAGRR